MARDRSGSTGRRHGWIPPRRARRCRAAVRPVSGSGSGRRVARSTTCGGRHRTGQVGGVPPRAVQYWLAGGENCTPAARVFGSGREL
jgi:hypothetical protein